MSRIQRDPRLPTIGAQNYEKNLSVRLTELFREIIGQLNGTSESSIKAATNAAIAAPTTGDWTQGDEIRNSAPTEQGTGGSKYVIRAWICTASGTPGTWLSERVLTGN